MRKPVLLVIGIGIIIGIIIFLSLAIKEKRPGQGKSAASLFREADGYLAQDKLVEANKTLKLILPSLSNPKKIEGVRKKIEKINMRILFSPVLDECSKEYIVKRNDNLIKIAKQFNTCVGLIKRANGLKSHIIKPEQKLKVNICKFSLVIDKSQNMLFLKRNNEIIKTYLVATGKDNSTPVGVLKITNKLENPTWFKTGAVIPPGSPENILGTRWLGLSIKGYGIHGTKEPEKIGEQITLGCVRMRNEEVEEIFSIVPVGTEVMIVD